MNEWKTEINASGEWEGTLQHIKLISQTNQSTISIAMQIFITYIHVRKKLFKLIHLKNLIV